MFMKLEYACLECPVSLVHPETEGATEQEIQDYARNHHEATGHRVVFTINKYFIPA